MLLESDKTVDSLFLSNKSLDWLSNHCMLTHTNIDLPDIKSSLNDDGFEFYGFVKKYVSNHIHLFQDDKKVNESILDDLFYQYVDTKEKSGVFRWKRLLFDSLKRSDESTDKYKLRNDIYNQFLRKYKLVNDDGEEL